MFTGLIQKTGRLVAAESRGDGKRLTVQHEPWDGDPLIVGESMAVQGACLTIADATRPGRFGCDVLSETLHRTTLGKTRPGTVLNLERAVRQGDRLGGHIVSGHVDGRGRIAEIRACGEDLVLRVTCEPHLTSGLIPKGSIAVDGISLTISERNEEDFEVCIIPHTWNHTSLQDRTVGDEVNLETDMLGKYVQSHLARSTRIRSLCLEDLERAGFL